MSPIVTDRPRFHQKRRLPCDAVEETPRKRHAA
jgi:hypothetical protein